MSKPGAVCLMGPTASGKTDLALSLADTHPFEIVSVDSAMVYRGLDIGTAKPSRDITARYPHHLIDIRDPADPYSAATFRSEALSVMGEIRERGKIPLLVGGTMLYFRALVGGLAELPSADEAVRAKIVALAREIGWTAMHDRLAVVDPEAARRIHPNDPQRLQRALEIYELSGTPMTELHRVGKESCPWQFCQVAVVPEDRQGLHGRIERRFSSMLDAGFVDEVRGLRRRGDLNSGLPSIKAVGYRQVWAHLDGAYGYDEMIDKGVAATRQLAKRQLTWLRSWPDIKIVAQAEPMPVLKILKAGSILG
jgi:tRNA dimethylallyltransferase